MNLSLFISWRYLYAKRKQVFVSFITFISVAGVCLGVAALVITLSIMNGFQNDLREKILASNPHIIVMGIKGNVIENYPETINSILNSPQVKACAPFV